MTNGILPPWENWTIEQLKKEYEECLTDKQNLIAYMQLLEAKLRIEGTKNAPIVAEIH